MHVSPPRHGSRRPVRALTIAALALAWAPACRCGGGAADADASAPVTSDPKVEGVPFVREETKLGHDAGAGMDPACSGTELALGARIVDARCAISASRAKQLRALLEGAAGAEAGAGALPLRQEARLASDGRVELRLVNAGSTPLTLPLSYHAKLPAFTALAEDERFTVYELESPRLEVVLPEHPSAPEAGAAPATSAAAAPKVDRPHFASIVLAPGGAAVATVAISPVVVRVMRRGKRDACGDASAEASAEGIPCNVTRLPRGRYTLHVGELLTDVEAGAPARLSWEVP